MARICGFDEVPTTSSIPINRCAMSYALVSIPFILPPGWSVLSSIYVYHDTITSSMHDHAVPRQPHPLSESRLRKSLPDLREPVAKRGYGFDLRFVTSTTSNTSVMGVPPPGRQGTLLNEWKNWKVQLCHALDMDSRTRFQDSIPGLVAGRAAIRSRLAELDRASAAGFLPPKAQSPEQDNFGDPTTSPCFVHAKIGLGHDVRIL